jgi:hypothetical protein
MPAYYFFSKSPIPQHIDQSITKVVAELKKNTTPESYLKGAYDYITTHYESGRLNTFLRLFDLYAPGLTNLWRRKGFMHCTNQNFLLAVLLVRSGFFTDSDIKLKWTLISYYSPHEYLKVKVGNHWVEVDCWARQYGVGFGKHAYGFNTTTHKSLAPL